MPDTGARRARALRDARQLAENEAREAREHVRHEACNARGM